MSGRLLVAVTPLFLWVAFNSASAQTIKDFPEGAGKPFVEQICMQCHEPAFLLQQRKTEDDWKKTVARMSRKGAGGAPEAYDTVAAYMAKNFNKDAAAAPTAIAANAAAPNGRGQNSKDFPEGDGKQFVQQICMQCHEPAFLLQQHRAEDDWKKTVARMSRKGAGGAPEAYDTVAAYMAKNFGRVDQEGKVNMNKVTVDELVEKLGFTKDEAVALVAYREKNGDFREWGDMLVIFGVDGRKLQAAKDKMNF